MNNKFELTTRVIDNEDFNRIDLKNDSSKKRLFKKIDKKFIITIAIFIAIILCLLSILILRVFYSSPSPKEQTDQTDKEKKTEQTKQTEENKETEEKRKIKYLNLSVIPEFRKFCDLLPYMLKIGEGTGELVINYNSLRNVPADNLNATEDYYYEFSKIEINEEYKRSSSEIYDLSLFCNVDILFRSKFRFTEKINEVTEGSKNVTYIMVKKKLGSILIDRDYIQLKDIYKEDIIQIAYQNCSVEDKAKDLDYLFTQIGYFIPSTITIGGYFYKELSQIEDKTIINKTTEFKGNISYDWKIYTNASADYEKVNEEVFKNLYKEEKIIIVGGDSNKKNYEEWEKSLNYENAQIIEYNNLIEITDLINNFFSDNVSVIKKLKDPLDIVRQKYGKRKAYYTKLNEAKMKIKTKKIQKDSATDGEGLLEIDKDYEDLMYQDTIRMKAKWGWGTVTKKVNKIYHDIIVGWIVQSNWGSSDNAKYSFENPILSNKIDITFKSKWFTGQDYTIKIFLMKCPE